jgi:threonine dehydratase
MATTGSLISLDDVHCARERIGGRLHRTPMLSSATLSKQVDAVVLFKAELLQRTGAFKPRGVLNKLATLTEEEKERGVISIAAARGYGATIDTEAPDIPSAFERLEELIESTGRTLVHPYDDPLVMAGQGTVGLEIMEDAPDTEVVLVQVGGGGLISGIATAVKGINPDVRVIAVEPERSPALHESLKAGEPVTVEAKSIADGLNGPYAGANCVRVCTEFGVESILVSEEALEDAFRFMYGRMKLACEVAGAATAAALLSAAFVPEAGQSVAAVVSGGNVAAKTAAAILNSDEA